MRHFAFSWWSVVVLLGACMTVGHAQTHERLHWVFPADSVQEVRFRLVDDFEVINWDGNQIMVASEITVENASAGTMKFFIEENRRYDVVNKSKVPGVLQLSSYHSRRAPIQSNGRACTEQVKVTIYLPTIYTLQGDEVWVRGE